MSVSAVEPSGFVPFVAPPSVPASAPTSGPASASASSPVGESFGDLVLDNLDRLEGVQDRSDQLAVQAATGDLDDIHDYTIAATEASVATQLTVAVRNRAIEAFSEIMRMPV
jgi:flagellar hook-basal body complex protein FliE